MSNLQEGFIELRCCGTSLGFVNAHPFTATAIKRVHAIQQKLGDAWAEDVEAKALMADKASYGPPPDGTPILLSCARCGAYFTWVGGVPAQAASS